MVALALLAAVFYAVLRRVGASWWVWGTFVAVSFLVLLVLVAPVVIDPLFNTYKPVADGTVKNAVLTMAHANGVPADDIYEYDASRQTTRVSANVSGILGSASVRLNDNLLRRSSLSEIRAVMGHELGRYVMNHVYKMIAAFSLLLLAGFLFTQWAMTKLLARFGSRFGLRGISDAAGFPLILAVMSVFVFAATPITNTLSRTQEIEADRFGLNLAREPHGNAEVDLKLTEYRKPDPTPLEEFVFFDHPSTRFRIHDAMRWREAMGTPYRKRQASRSRTMDINVPAGTARCGASPWRRSRPSRRLVRRSAMHARRVFALEAGDDPSARRCGRSSRLRWRRCRKRRVG
jgi:STE24 endopeptidase